jgi:hypothetical protein
MQTGRGKLQRRAATSRLPTFSAVLFRHFLSRSWGDCRTGHPELKRPFIAQLDLSRIGDVQANCQAETNTRVLSFNAPDAVTLDGAHHEKALSPCNRQYCHDGRSRGPHDRARRFSTSVVRSSMGLYPRAWLGSRDAGRRAEARVSMAGAAPVAGVGSTAKDFILANLIPKLKLLSAASRYLAGREGQDHAYGRSFSACADEAGI